MPNYDDGESFAEGDGLDRFDWSRAAWLILLRQRVNEIQDDGERLEVARRLIRDLYQPEIEHAAVATTTGSVWLHDLPEVLRAAGLNVDVYPGWELRSRSSGGYDALLALQVHHTASDASPESDMAWMWDSSPDAPIGAIHLARTGKVTIGAAGATNTSGKGGPLETSRGTIPLDSGNRYILSVEAANDGVGEEWPDVQIDAYLLLAKTLCDVYGFNLDVPEDCHAHFEWTSRKIDPAGPSPYASGANSWNMGLFRHDVATYATNPPPTIPPTDPGDDEMQPIRVRFSGYNNVFLLTGGGYTHLTEVLNEHYSDIPLIVSDAHPEGMKAACHQSGITLDDLVPGAP